MKNNVILDLSGSLNDHLRNNLEEKFTVIQIEGSDKGSVLENIKEANAVLLASQGNIDKEVINRGKQLKVIGRIGTGFQNVDIDYATKMGIYVVYSGTANSDTVADLAFGLLLSVARNITIANHKLRLTDDKIWDFKTGDKFIGTDVSRKTIGIIGFGRIGKCMAKRALGFSMKVLVHDPYITDVSDPSVQIFEKDELVCSADYITIHIPLNDQTLNYIDSRELEMMKNSAILVNAAYGGIVNEEALYQALINGEIAGAGIDTAAGKIGELNFCPQNELYNLENVVVTPFLGAKTRECGPRSIHVVVDQIVKVLNNKKPEFAHNSII